MIQKNLNLKNKIFWSSISKNNFLKHQSNLIYTSKTHFFLFWKYYQINIFSNYEVIEVVNKLIINCALNLNLKYNKKSYKIQISNETVNIIFEESNNFLLVTKFYLANIIKYFLNNQFNNSLQVRIIHKKNLNKNIVKKQSKKVLKHKKTKFQKTQKNSLEQAQDNKHFVLNLNFDNKNWLNEIKKIGFQVKKDHKTRIIQNVDLYQRKKIHSLINQFKDLNSKSIGKNKENKNIKIIYNNKANKK